MDPLTQYVYISRLSGTYGRTLIETVHQALFGAPAEQTAALTTLEHPLLRSPSRDTNAGAGLPPSLVRTFPSGRLRSSRRPGSAISPVRPRFMAAASA